MVQALIKYKSIAEDLLMALESIHIDLDQFAITPTDLAHLALSGNAIDAAKEKMK